MVPSQVLKCRERGECAASLERSMWSGKRGRGSITEMHSDYEVLLSYIIYIVYDGV